ncbi:hypothetical protein ACVWYH_003330 [Bradyrhizobium sp. GM24.11]
MTSINQRVSGAKLFLYRCDQLKTLRPQIGSTSCLDNDAPVTFLAIGNDRKAYQTNAALSQLLNDDPAQIATRQSVF